MAWGPVRAIARTQRWQQTTRMQRRLTFTPKPRPTFDQCVTILLPNASYLFGSTVPTFLFLGVQIKRTLSRQETAS
jgi:hypothetical protein